ncbi:hypothetical protein D3C73_1359080 [compost metagenome]
MLGMGDHFDQFVLQRVRILELIDHDILEFLLQLLQQPRLFTQHPVGDQQHIIEIDFEIITFPRLIAQQNSLHFLLGRGGLRKAVRLAHVHFARGKQGQQRFRRISILRQPQFTHDLL